MNIKTMLSCSILTVAVACCGMTDTAPSLQREISDLRTQIAVAQHKLEGLESKLAEVSVYKDQVYAKQNDLLRLQSALESGRAKIDTMVEDRDKAIALLSSSMEKRLEGMNEFRSQLKDQQANFVTRDVFDSYQKTHESRVHDLEQSVSVDRANLLTKQNYDIYQQDLVKRVESLQMYQANQEGRMWALGAGLALFFSIGQVVAYFVSKRGQPQT